MAFPRQSKSAIMPYVYGAPASGNRLTGQVYVRPLREAVKALPGYQFGSVTEEELSQDLELEETTLDAQGKATVGVENRWAEAKSPLQLILQASLQESGGRPITRRLVQPVWPAERLPGLRGLFDGENVDGDGLAEFEVLLADPAGNKLASDNLQVRLIRERRDYYWSFSESEGWNYHYNEKFLNLGEEGIKVAAGGTAKVSFPVEWGPYRVEVTDPETGLTSSLRFWAGYSWQDNTEGGAVRPDQVKLALDKPAYGAGDTAQITVTPPSGGSGYLMVESSDGPLWWQEIEVPAEGKSFDIPLAKDWARHDLYVSALVIRPGERKAGATPKRAVGLLHLPFDRAPRQLQVSLTAPEKMRPQQPLKVKVQAKNADGSPAYASANAAALGRVSQPAQELTLLSHYRLRHAQYKSDPDSKALHARMPMIAVWDDHEIANDAYKDGADNHDPQTEGSFADRKRAALQAYHEWMPIRTGSDPAVIYRSFDFGQLLSLHMLDTRLIGRDQQVGFGDLLNPATASTAQATLASPTRQLLGTTQLSWLQGQMAQSGATWQVLGQQVLMGNMAFPISVLKIGRAHV